MASNTTQVRPTCRFFSRFHVRQVLLLTGFWFTVCYLVFHVSHNQRAITYVNSHIGNRELLQQEVLADYSHDITKKQHEELYLEAKINIDNSPTPSEKELLKRLSKNSNLPLAYWAEAKTRSKTNNTCSKFPSLFDLDFNNIYWQRMVTENATFYLYGAYLDSRKLVGEVPVVRILSMVDKVKPPPTFCHFWYDSPTNPNQKPYSNTSYTYMWFNKWGNYKDGILQPYVITCPLPSNLTKHIPASVSLMVKPCGKPENNLKVIYNKPEKKQDFAVCVKGLDFLYEDISVRLIEWIELLHILGAKKIFLYELEVHPNITKVLSYYIEKGMVTLTPISLPGNQPNLPGFRHLYLKSKIIHKRQNELIPYNDCLYKNLYSYEHIALLDTDEVIMPLEQENWKDMMEVVIQQAVKERNYSRASYNFRNVYFLDDLIDGEEMNHEAHEKGIPKYLHMLQHVYRSKNYTKPGSYVKCFHNTERVISLHNHFPLNCFGKCTTYSVNTTIAHMQHYRKDCVGPLKKVCKDYRSYTVRDTSIWRYKDELVKRTTQALNELGFFDNAQKYMNNR